MYDDIEVNGWKPYGMSWEKDYGGSLKGRVLVGAGVSSAKLTFSVPVDSTKLHIPGASVGWEGNGRYTSLSAAFEACDRVAAAVQAAGKPFERCQ